MVIMHETACRRVLALLLLTTAGCALMAGVEKKNLPSVDAAANDGDGIDGVTEPDGEEGEGDAPVDELPVDPPSEDAETEPSCSMTGNLRVTEAARISSSPSLTWNWIDTVYGLAWYDERAVTGIFDIYFARMAPDGSKAGDDSHIETSVFFSFDPSLVFSGTEYAVAWHDFRCADVGWAPEIFFARIGTAGSKIDDDVRVTDQAGESRNASLAFNSGGYGVAWEDERSGAGQADIFFARLDPAGAKIGIDVAVTSTHVRAVRPSLVFTGAQYGVAWEDERDGNSEIYFNLIGVDGTLAGENVRITDAMGSSAVSALVWNGAGFGLAWYDGREGGLGVYFAAVDVSGNKVGTDVRVADAFETPSDGEKLDLAWSPEESAYGLVWHDDRDGNLEVYFARILGDGTKPEPDIRVSDGLGDSDQPDLAWSGSQWGVVWKDYRQSSENPEIYFSILTCDATP
jgi:hypothetical protein